MKLCVTREQLESAIKADPLCETEAGASPSLSTPPQEPTMTEPTLHESFRAAQERKRRLLEQEPAMADPPADPPLPALLPCPFCGNAEDLQATTYTIYCPGCGAEGPQAGEPAADQAAEGWNRRSMPESGNE